MTATKKPISALEMQRKSKSKRYEPIGYMMLKLRHIMGKREANYILENEIEVDEGFFETVILSDEVQTEELNKIPKPKRGRGSQRQGKVLVMIESKAVKQEKPYRKNRVIGFAKLIAIEDASAKTINYEVGQSVAIGTIINRDLGRGYSLLEKSLGMIHKPKKVPPPKNACSIYLRFTP